MTPLFSIIIPTYNRAHLICKTLKSVLEQVYKNFEVIIVDDGSTDNTSLIVHEFIKKNDLTNFHYYFKENAERGVARNYGIEIAKGKWITFLDSDDLLYENHLKTATEFINSNFELSVFHSAYEFRDENGILIKKVKYPTKRDLNDKLIRGNLCSCFGMFIKNEILNKFKFNENRDLSGTEDWLLWLQIATQYSIYIQPQVSGCMTQHSNRSVLSFDENKLLKRKETLINSLLYDQAFISKFGLSAVKQIEGHMLTYIALHLILMKNKKSGIFYFLKGVFKNKKEIFTSRTLAIFKHLLYN
jgi:glycosyltransferase involved in cell wall biosynthesis